MLKQWKDEVDKLLANNDKTRKYRIIVHSIHTHASWLAVSGISIIHIKEQLGHKKLDMTLMYAHLIHSRRHDLIKEVFCS